MMTQHVARLPPNQNNPPCQNHNLSESADIYAGDSLDKVLIKARRRPHLKVESVPVAPNPGQQSYLSVPEPKVWRRSLKKQAYCPPAVDTLALQPAQECTAPIHNIATSDIDDWTRDYLVLAGLNENEI
jgi:hypothetical protein